jgi:hypothetical protein
MMPWHPYTPPVETMDETRYLVGCWTEGCFWRQIRRDIIRTCPEGHPAQQMKVLVRCDDCPWEGWRSRVEPCPRRHAVKIMKYRPI